MYGAATGRDGIGGVSVLASNTLEDGAEERRPSVQIGDPFAEKLLIEASLELVERDLLEGLQDLGGAGITCAVSESASRAGLGAELDLGAVPLREPGLEAFEILTSESQERMLAIVHPDRLDEVRGVCERWGLPTAVIGRLVRGGGLRATIGGAAVADVPARSLADEGPVYTRTMAAPAEVEDAIAEDPTFATVTMPPDEAFLAVLGSPNVASKRWVWEQYDSIVLGGTVTPPGADAALVRIEGTLKAIALSTDGKGRFGALDPYLGAAHAVAESARNVACAGATPLAITNCLNFGNPQREEIMGQFVGCLQGMAEACRELDFPIVSGNVSLYNETKNEDGSSRAILPTPAIGGVGLIGDWESSATIGFKAEGETLILIGHSTGHVGQSLWLEVCHGRREGPPPPVDLAVERRLGQVARDLIANCKVTAIHDVSDGGALVAISEMALAGGIGAEVKLPSAPNPAAILFGEDQGRMVITTRWPEGARAIINAAQLFAIEIGTTGGDAIVIRSSATGKSQSIALSDLRAAHESFFPKLMSSELTPEF
jgi:phosphoribosylformylglycinamidine synthase